MLEWIFRRCDGAAEAVETPIGLVPRPARSTPTASTSPTARLEALLRVDPEEWKPEIEQVREHLAKFGDRLPGELRAQLEALEERLESS